MARNELIMPIDDLVKATNLDLKQWFPNVLDVFRFDVKSGARGKSTLPLMGLPTVAYSGATVLFLNPGMFEKKGVKLPTADMSFDDLVETGLKMTERQGARRRRRASTASSSRPTAATSWSAGCATSAASCSRRTARSRC